MLGLLGRMFGTDKAFDGLITNASKGVDALFYTKEEKAHDQAKFRTQAADQAIKFLEATNGQNLTRRFIALGIFVIWSSNYLVSMGFTVISVFISTNHAALAEAMNKASTLIDQRISDVEGILMVVLTFYFMSPHVKEGLDTMNTWLKDRKEQK